MKMLQRAQSPSPASQAGRGERANYNKMEYLPYISKIPCSLLQGASIAVGETVEKDVPPCNPAVPRDWI